MNDDEDEDATLLMPSPRRAVDDDAESESCPTPAVGVASMGDTYFEATQSGAPTSPVAGAGSGLADSPKSLGDVSEMPRNAPSTPITTTTPLRRGARPARAPWWLVLQRRKLLWPAALLGGAIVGLVVALALRAARSSTESGASVDSVAKGLRSSDADSAMDELEEVSPSPGASKTVSRAGPATATPGGQLLTEDEVRVLQKEALLAELGGDCQESMRLYAELESGDQPAARERWQLFLRAVRHHCAHVDPNAKIAGEGP